MQKRDSESVTSATSPADPMAIRSRAGLHDSKRLTGGIGSPLDPCSIGSRLDPCSIGSPLDPPVTVRTTEAPAIGAERSSLTTPESTMVPADRAACTSTRATPRT